MTRTVVDRVNLALNGLYNAYPGQGELWSQSRKLYYKLLQSMVLGDRSVNTQRTDFSMILQHDLWHRSVIACACEAMRAILEINTVTVMDIMDRVHLTSYDLCLGIEYVMRFHHELLSWDLIKHFMALEERVLEEDLWQREEPFYTELRNERANTADNLLKSPQRALKFITDSPAYMREMS